MKRSSVFIMILFCSCIKEQKHKRADLDLVAHKVQRAAFWQREYSWEVIKWTKRGNEDSVRFYEAKMDSVLLEYKFYNRMYDALVQMYDNEKSAK